MCCESADWKPVVFAWQLSGDYDKTIENMLEDGSLLDQELYDKHTAVPYYTDSNTHMWTRFKTTH